MTARTRRWTTDLLAVLVATVLATGAVWLGLGGSLLRTAVVLPFVVFLPGYALVSALFPERRQSETEGKAPVEAPEPVAVGISPIARIGLAVAISIAAFPAVLWVSSFVHESIRVVTSFYVLAAGTVLLTLIALGRRVALPAGKRFGVTAVTRLVGDVTRPFVTHERSLSKSATFLPTSKRGVFVNVLLAASVVALVGSVAVAYAAPTQGQQFTELYLTTQSDDGEFVAANYPQSFEVGQEQPVYATVTNHEGEQVTYTLVATIQRVDGTGSDARVTEERELLRTERTVDAGDTARIRHDLQPPFQGERLRVQYLLYVGEPPADPSRETAYRRVHLWISVGGGGDGDGGGGGGGSGDSGGQPAGDS
jgi:uncharacterized membrane protein